MPTTLTEELLAAPVLDPTNPRTLAVLEDVLGLHCFCLTRPSPYCQVHSGSGLVEALERLQEAHADALCEAREAGAKQAEEDAADQLKDLEEKQAEVDELEERVTKLECAAEDLVTAAGDAVKFEAGLGLRNEVLMTRMTDLAEAVKEMTEALK